MNRQQQQQPRKPLLILNKTRGIMNIEKKQKQKQNKANSLYAHRIKTRILFFIIF